jgi:hypothetical protein
MRLYYIILKSMLLETFCPEYNLIIHWMEDRNYQGNLYALALDVSCGNINLGIQPISKHILIDIMMAEDNEGILSNLIDNEEVFNQCLLKAKESYISKLKN